MKYAIFFLLWMCGLFVSCGTDETIVDPFKGTDNYIYSFALVAGGQVYNAEVTDTLIRVTLPPETPLAGASALYELAEKATIEPAPETITDWSQPIDFVVVSHSGDKRTYRFEYVYEDRIYDGDVFLKTQAEVDAFAATGITAIEGTLTVGFYEDRPVVHVDSLIHLRRVSGAIVFKNPANITDIGGLSRLEEIGGLSVPENENITSVSFPNLKVVTSDLTINSKYITAISLPSLRTVIRNFYCRNKGKDKNSCNINRLEICGGVLSVRGEGTEFIFSKLTNVGNLNIGSDAGFPALSKVSDILIENDSASFPALEECKSIQIYNNGRGDFPILTTVIESANVSSSTSMPCLKTVGGDFAGFSPLLESVGGAFKCDSDLLAKMPYLQKVGELEINLSSSVELVNLQIGQKLIVRQSKDAVCTLKGPEECDYTLDIYFSDKPEHIAFEGFKRVGALYAYLWEGSIALPFVHEIEGNCNCVVGNSRPGDEIELKNLNRVEGTVSLFAHKIFCPNLLTIGKKLKISENNIAFEELSLPVLRAVGDGSLAQTNPCLDIDLRWCKSLSLPALNRISGSVSIAAGIAERVTMPVLTTLDGTLQITGTNSSLAVLDFPLLAAIRKVEIKDCVALKDFSAFAGVIPALNTSTWRISGCGYNPTWQDMSDGKYIGQ